MKKIDKNLLKELGYTDIDEEHEKELIAQLWVILNQRVSFRIADELEDEDYDEYEKLEGKPDEVVTKWLAEKIPDQEQIFEEEIERMVKDLLHKRDETVKVYEKLKKENESQKA